MIFSTNCYGRAIYLLHSPKDQVFQDKIKLYRFALQLYFAGDAYYASNYLLNYPLDNKLQHIYNVIMNSISFSWDDRKNITNQKKHRISFEEAQPVFFDEHAIEYYDPNHSETEDRFLMLGHSYRVRILVVSHNLRKDGAEIRIISARKATKKEQKEYSGEKL